MLLDLGLAYVPTQKYIHRYPSAKGLFKVSLIPGTFLEITLLVNKTAAEMEILKDGNIPLHIICALPDVSPEIVSLFLEAGTVDIDIQNESNHLNALMIATARGNLDVVTFLVGNGADVNITAFIPLNPQGRLGFQYDYMKLFTRKAIVIPRIHVHFSALVSAVYEDRSEVLRYLLKNGADVNVQGQSWMALFNPTFTGKRKIMEILLENGIDVNNRDVMGSSALQKAAQKGDVEMAKLLLKYGAQANATDNFGWTPLHVAAFFSRSATKEMIKLLLDAGCDANGLTDGGFSPLNLVVAGNNLSFLEHLLRKFDLLGFTGHGGLEDLDSNEEHAEIIDFLLSQEADLDHQDDIMGWTTLHWAAAAGDLRVAKLLVEKYGASMTIRSKKGMTPFGTAKHFGRKAVIEFLNTDRNLVF